MSDKKNIKSMEANSPEKDTFKLPPVKKANPFIVPDGYFEEFPSSLNGEINKQTDRSISQTQKVFRLKVITKLAWAASIIILGLVGAYFLLNQHHDDKSLLTETFTWEEVFETRNYMISEFYENQFVDAIIYDELNQDVINWDSYSTLNVSTGFSSEDIINYLVESNYPMDIIYEM
ncbi:MAG: hypothetical protein KAG99_05700 [Bacteroidales bacterium]|nr:hypothetical protein [Bacteroidales bacterium]